MIHLRQCLANNKPSVRVSHLTSTTRNIMCLCFTRYNQEIFPRNRTFSPLTGMHSPPEVSSVKSLLGLRVQLSTETTKLMLLLYTTSLLVNLKFVKALKVILGQKYD